MRVLFSMLCRTVLLGLLPLAAASAADTPPATAGAYKHLGVASCATSVCHGKETEQTGRDVALNEYRIWLEQDRHSQAYRALDGPRSRQIAANLGLPSATTAKIEASVMASRTVALASEGCAGENCRKP